MDENIVPQNWYPIKDTYASKHESLCAKLQQARNLIEMLESGDVLEMTIPHFLRALSELIKQACSECVHLTADDFKHPAK